MSQFSFSPAKQGLDINAVFLELAIDIHTSIEDEQDEHAFTAYRVIDVVSLLKNEAADAAFLVIDVCKQRSGALALYDEAVDFKLNGLG